MSKFASKITDNFIVVCLAMLANGFCYAQSSYAIKSSATYDGTKIYLRWAPQNFETWQWANGHGGYIVERVTLELDGTEQTPQQMYDSKVELGVFFPLDESQWETLPDTNLAGIVAGSIYGDSLEVLDMGDADFMTVVNTTQNRQNRFGFSLFACDQNFDIAVAAGLAFIDETVEEKSKYLYSVRLTEVPPGTQPKRGTAIVATDAAAGLPALPKPGAEAGDKMAMLSWDKESFADVYSNYVVERSSDGGETYTVVNTAPFVSLSNLGDGKTRNSFLDSLPSNGVLYIYRVRGKSPYGLLGPASDTVHVMGRPAPVAGQPVVTQVTEPTAGQLKLEWTFPANLEPQITEFQVWRALNIDGPYTVLGNATPSTRMYTDNSPLPADYYVVKAKDVNNNLVASLPFFGQPKDDVAPAAPTGLTGTCSPTGTVTIHWSPNAEADIAGYRLFTSEQNQVDTDFVQITSDPVRDTTYNFTVNLHTLTGTLYVAVRAVDYRENSSPSSVYLPVQLEDIVAPVSPTIVKATPRPEAVELRITLSPSNDVFKYKVEKRLLNAREWTELASVLAPNMPTLFVDSLSYLNPVSRRRDYEYRVVAYDEEGHAASSNLVRARPLDQGIRAPVTDLTATYFQMQNVVVLNWKYTPDPDLVGFQIYRAIDTSALRSLVMISALGTAAGNATYQDRDLKFKTMPLVTSFVQAPTNANGVATTVTAQVVNKPISTAANAWITLKYRVMAVYFDGATSPLSDQVQVVIQ